MNRSVIYQAAALLLGYPDEDLLTKLDLIEDAVAGSGSAEHFAPLLAHLRARPLLQAQAFHTAEFDWSRRHALHLTYWTSGDTRRRGQALVAVKAAYTAAGFELAAGELPDYLPALLEFAVLEPDAGYQLLESLRPAIELARISLADDDLPHAGVLTAVCATFPGESPATSADVHRLMAATAEPEAVGIDLLPLDLVRS